MVVRLSNLSLICISLTIGLFGCTRSPAPIATYDRNHDGQIEEWVYLIGSKTEDAFDTNTDGKADLIKIYDHGELVKVEQDRNHDGRMDLIQEYQGGKLARVVRDNNFHGKPETVEIYRNGKLAMVEHDSDGCGVADSVDYYEHGRLIRTQVRATKR
ncbi:MAG TPA: hypothetical protein VKV28_04995 [Candidatus Binataceae bacterium]|nr:hypothetical protein [Candidatus Binataceae bacterium]